MTHHRQGLLAANTAAVMLALSCASKAVAAQEAQPPSGQIISVSADRIEYYSDAATIQARGDVRVALTNGAVVRGDAFSMDLALQRFVVAGHVSLQAYAGELHGAALADFLQFRRIYFVPLDPSADRWTFLNGDFAHPEKGRVMPGDAFFLPDFNAQHPYIVAKSAEIDPATYVKFAPATFVWLNGSLQTPPLPPFTYNFSPNQNFAVNSLAGASYDAPYNFAGSNHFLDAVHLRYDSQRKTYFSFEHHSVFAGGGYAVFSLNPATQRNKQWNLLAYAPTSSRSALSLQGQLFTDQPGLFAPASSNGFADLRWIRQLNHSSLILDLTQQYNDLLGGGRASPNHQFVSGLNWLGFDQPLARTGLIYRLQSGIARAHDVFGLSGSGLRDVWTHFAGASLYTPVYPAPLHSGLNAVFTAQRTWLSFPNQVDTQTIQLSDSKRFTNAFNGVLSYIVQNVNTDSVALSILTPNAAAGLSPQPWSPNGLPIIDGAATIYPHTTNHALVLTLSYAPNPNFQFTLTALRNAYQPVQQPFLAGPPKYHLIGDMRFKITKTLFLDLGRQYFFNWANQTFSPQFTFQVTPQ